MHGPAPEQNIEVVSPNRSFCMSEFEYYEEGKGGCCAGFTPSEGYWCSSKTSGGGAFTYRIPSGMTIPSETLPNSPYKSAVGAVVQAWVRKGHLVQLTKTSRPTDKNAPRVFAQRPGHWASWMFEVDSASTLANKSTELGWHIGGFQGARGSNKGAEWFVENIMEELDAENEFYFDESSSMLYLYYNASAGTAPPADMVVEATSLQDYIQILGTPPTRGGERVPVVNVSLQGITIRDAAATYLEPHVRAAQPPTLSVAHFRRDPLSYPTN
jgi:hypothetical protein